MKSVRHQIETVYAALAFIERNAVQEASPLLDEMPCRPSRASRRAGQGATRTRRPERRPELRAD